MIVDFFTYNIENIICRLFLGLSHIGEIVSPNLSVHGYTEIEKDGNIFSAYPCFSKK